MICTQNSMGGRNAQALVSLQVSLAIMPKRPNSMDHANEICSWGFCTAKP